MHEPVTALAYLFTMTRSQLQLFYNYPKIIGSEAELKLLV